MRHLVFLVHGMGVHERAPWEAAIVAKLREVSQAYAFFRERPFDELVEVVPVHYGEHVATALRQWQEMAGPVSAFARAQELEGADSLDWLDGVAEVDAGFFWTHLVDVVVYRFLRLYRERIRASVIDQIAGRLDAALAGGGEVDASVLAHSLGTSVAHDSLHVLGTARPGGLANAFAPPQFSFRNFFAVANVSRLLQTDVKAYLSIVRPGPRNSAKSYFTRYLDFRHEYDPFPMPWPFEPVDWGSLYASRCVGQLRKWNVHALEHYLDNPWVHIPILCGITRSDAISRGEKIRAVDPAGYPVFGGELQPLESIKRRLLEIKGLAQDLGEEPSLERSLRFAAETWAVLKEIGSLAP